MVLLRGNKEGIRGWEMEKRSVVVGGSEINVTEVESMRKLLVKDGL